MIRSSFDIPFYVFLAAALALMIGLRWIGDAVDDYTPLYYSGDSGIEIPELVFLPRLSFSIGTFSSILASSNLFDVMGVPSATETKPPLLESLKLMTS